MINIEINPSHKLYGQLLSDYPSAPTVEVNSYGADTIVSVLIPLAAILAPTISPLIIKLIGDRNVSIKYNGIEVSGDYRNVKKIITQIKSELKTDNKDSEAEEVEN